MNEMLSKETIKTICKTMKKHKMLLINLLRNSESNTEKEKEFRIELIEVENALKEINNIIINNIS